MVTKIILFLILNFGALALGGIFAGKGVPSDWYVNLDKAPWTPPGWVFGAAWTTIMICFSVYMASLWTKTNDKTILIVLFAIQWVLNVGWNPTFFYYHQVAAALVIISALTILIGTLLFFYAPVLKLNSLFILPYFVWLLIASSLNGYVFFKNG